MRCVIVAAGHWYGSATFWAVAGVAATLLVGVPAILVARVPRQHLYYHASPVIPLLNTRHGGLTNLEVRHNGRILADPHVLDLRLLARGRHDIPSNAFDEGRPLVFDLGAEVIDLLQVRREPPTLVNLPVTHAGTRVSVGPEFIGHREEIVISVLLAGATSQVLCVQQVLAQVTVEPKDLSLRDPSVWTAIRNEVVSDLALRRLPPF
jgi:hypothetical protein